MKLEEFRVYQSSMDLGEEVWNIVMKCLARSIQLVSNSIITPNQLEKPPKYVHSTNNNK
ncbi:MAG: hypothetical protein L3J31_01270 [Bacteroidales bacterium]|nr:hypothetical protein [Bacteroidales bacterium]MCF6341420.1 hypothetical protein [Bacteroidales bacterium]